MYYFHFVYQINDQVTLWVRTLIQNAIHIRENSRWPHNSSRIWVTLWIRKLVKALYERNMYFVVCHNDEHSKIGHNYRKKCTNITVAMIRVFEQRTYIFLRFRWLHIDKNLAANYQGLSLITHYWPLNFIFNQKTDAIA